MWCCSASASLPISINFITLDLMVFPVPAPYLILSLSQQWTIFHHLPVHGHILYLQSDSSYICHLALKFWTCLQLTCVWLWKRKNDDSLATGTLYFFHCKFCIINILAKVYMCHSPQWVDTILKQDDQYMSRLHNDYIQRSKLSTLIWCMLLVLDYWWCCC